MDPQAAALIIVCILAVWLATLVPLNRYRGGFMAVVLVAVVVVLISAFFAPGWLAAPAPAGP